MKQTDNLRTTKQNRHIHWLFGQLGINENAKVEMVWEHTNHRTQHTGEMNFIEAMDLINSLEKMRKKEQLTTSERTQNYGNDEALTRLDRKRKGVIKAIFRWYELQGKRPTMEYVKGTACQGAGVKDSNINVAFNKISEKTLTRLYAEFCKKQKIAEAMQTALKTVNYTADLQNIYLN
jgi:hypothetical protein